MSVFQPELGQEVETSLTRDWRPQPVPPVTESLFVWRSRNSATTQTVLFFKEPDICKKQREETKFMHFLKPIKEK